MSLTYGTWITQIALLSQFNSGDPNFLSNLPSCSDYATDRITRELDLLNTDTSTSTPTLTVGTRIVNLSSLNPVFNVIRDINIITPTGTTDPNLGSRNPMVISSRAFMDNVFGSSTVIGLPLYWRPVTDQIISVAPFPDHPYNIEVIGTVRPSPLSGTTSSNWISTYLPDLLIAASMIQMTGFMKNYGAQSDDPQQGLSWEDQYTKLRDSAGVEDAMRKYYATGWSSQLPNAYNPART